MSDIVQTIEMDKRFVPKLVEVVEKILDARDKLKLEELYLFGSLSRGDYTAMSDIDLLVITAGKPREISLMVEMMDLREDVYFPHVDVIVRNRCHLEDNSIFAQNVQRDKKVLWRKVV